MVIFIMRCFVLFFAFYFLNFDFAMTSYVNYAVFNQMEQI